MEPIFLKLDEVLEIHSLQVEQFGGSPGIRDTGLLESALATPASQFGGQFLHADIFEMSAAYLFHIVQNHPFVDANKRTGAQVAIVFLKLNGQKLTVDPRVFETLILAVAQGEMEKIMIAEFLRNNCKEVRQ